MRSSCGLASTPIMFGVTIPNRNRLESNGGPNTPFLQKTQAKKKPSLLRETGLDESLIAYASLKEANISTTTNVGGVAGHR